MTTYIKVRIQNIKQFPLLQLLTNALLLLFKIALSYITSGPNHSFPAPNKCSPTGFPVIPNTADCNKYFKSGP